MPTQTRRPGAVGPWEPGLEPQSLIPIILPLAAKEVPTNLNQLTAGV